VREREREETACNKRREESGKEEGGGY